MSIEEGSRNAPETSGRRSFIAMRGEVDTWAASLRHLMLLPVALSGWKLASYLDSLYFLLVEQAWHVAQGYNGESRVKRAGESHGAMSLIQNGEAQATEIAPLPIPVRVRGPAGKWGPCLRGQTAISWLTSMIACGLPCVCWCQRWRPLDAKRS